MSLPAAILAGGLGTRIGAITQHKIPKALIEVAGEPFIVHQLRLFHRQGIRRVVLCVGHLGEQIQEVIGDGQALGMDVAYSFDGAVLRGTGGAIQQAIPLLGDKFYVFYGDSYLDCDYNAPQQAFESSGKLALMTVFRNHNQWDSSNVIFRDGQIIRYDKRNRTPEMEYLDYGLGLFQASAFDPYSQETAFDLADVYMDLLAQGQLAGFEVKERFYEVGSPNGLAETQQYLRSKIE